MNFGAHKKALRILILFSTLVFVIILLLVLAIVYHTYFLNPYYEKTIEREYSTPDEELGINISETFIYTHIFDIERYYNPNDSTRRWPNVIDSEVIDFYSDRVSRFENQSKRVQVKMEYTANSTHFSNAEVNISPSRIRMKTDSNDERTIAFEDPDNIARFGLKYMNNSSIMKTIEPTLFSFNSSGYLVDMYFHYYEYTGRKAGYGKELRQIAVLGDDYTVKLILLVDFGNMIS